MRVRPHDEFDEWTVRAGAVVLATGGCAFLSGGAGSDVDTGDGLLMGAEVGAELSGMEFSNAYALTPVGDIRPALHFATLYDESGTPLGGAGLGSRAAAFAALADGRRVYAALDEIPGPLRKQLARTPWFTARGGDPVRCRCALSWRARYAAPAACSLPDSTVPQRFPGCTGRVT